MAEHNTDQSTQFNEETQYTEPTENGKSADVVVPKDKIEVPTPSPDLHTTNGKNGFLSSDDEDIGNKDAKTTEADRKKKKHKKPVLVYSGMEATLG